MLDRNSDNVDTCLAPKLRRKGLNISHLSVRLAVRFLFNSVQSLSHVRHFVTSWTAAHQASQSITNSWNLLKLMSIESVMPSNHLIFSCPLFLSSIFPSIRVFSKESVLIRWPKYWSFSLSITPSNEYSGLISFRIYWLELLVVQGTPKGLFSNTTVQKHQFFGTQLSL